MRGVAGLLGSVAAHGAILGVIVLFIGNPAPEPGRRPPSVSFSLDAQGRRAAPPEPPAVARRAVALPEPSVRAPAGAHRRVEAVGAGPPPEQNELGATEPGAARVIEEHLEAAGTGTGSGSGSGSGTENAGETDSAGADAAGADPVAIRAAISGAVRYPRVARSQGLEGEVLVRFHVDASGAVSGLTVLRSAGDLLDEAARAATLRAAPYRSPPGWVRVPVIFSLHDGQ